MNSKKFKDDLKRGLEFEEVVLKTLRTDGYNVIKNPDDKGIDLLITEGCEVKADHYNFHKNIKGGNAYIEFESYGKPSGIFKEEEFKLRWWIHSLSPDEFFIMEGVLFRKWIKERIDACNANASLTSKGFRVTSGGDGNRTKGLLVPVDEMKKQATKIYKI